LELRESTAHEIGLQVWNQGSKDIRDVISISKLIRRNDGHEEIEHMIRTMKKYGGN
jgi:hypothetical protein